jgi:hypothetical protein
MGMKLVSNTEEKYKLKVSENRVLRRIFGLQRERVAGGCIMRSFVTCMLHQILLW